MCSLRRIYVKWICSLSKVNIESPNKPSLVEDIGTLFSPWSPSLWRNQATLLWSPWLNSHWATLLWSPWLNSHWGQPLLGLISLHLVRRHGGLTLLHHEGFHEIQDVQVAFEQIFPNTLVHLLPFCLQGFINLLLGALYGLFGDPFFSKGIQRGLSTNESSHLNLCLRCGKSTWSRISLGLFPFPCPF